MKPYNSIKAEEKIMQQELTKDDKTFLDGFTIGGSKMTAEQMFEALGYKKVSMFDDCITWCNNNDWTIIVFDLIDNRYYATKHEEAFSIKVSLHKAITKQMEELGWL